MPPDAAHNPAPADAAHALQLSPAARLTALIGAGAVTLVLAMTPHFEGEVRRGYLDPANVVTACVGHTLTARLDRTYTHDECQALLAKDLLSHWQPLARCITVPLAPHTAAALLDAAFNLGPMALCRSAVVRRINAGDLAGGCRGLLEFAKVRLQGVLRDCREPAYARQCGGIVRRRQAEAALCAAPPTGTEIHLK